MVIGVPIVNHNLPGSPSLMMPVAFFWLEFKNEETYKRCWKIIREVAPAFAPETVHSDMEIALFSSFEKEFNVETQFCNFHINKVVYFHFNFIIFSC